MKTLLATIVLLASMNHPVALADDLSINGCSPTKGYGSISINHKNYNTDNLSTVSEPTYDNTAKLWVINIRFVGDNSTYPITSSDESDIKQQYELIMERFNCRN